MKEKNTPHFTLFGLEFPVDLAKILKLTLVIYALLFILVMVAMKFFGYELTDADIPGGIISGFLLAYLISII
ncbi:MAG TPA: hypothetical protein PLY70_09475 [Saprospiraceae bacterium]|nr:hypothetical protein [Saprospiraceae bacterium]HPN68844.1 hypothetical protein [Saprospiraceae bacterium]